MDEFSTVRKSAADLRSALPVDDLVDAPTLVRQAAGLRGLRLRPLAADDGELEGAHGLLDRKFKHILYRDDLPEDEMAQVVAHEIGHFEIHDGPEAGFYPRRHLNGGDPSQRIETYGIKERRERQANSFAREFVLPRALARRLFLEGRRASEIATLLKVPYETTLQQLADGLLLPDIAPVSKAPSVEYPCNDAQRGAVIHRGAPYLLGAGPGTGKTKTLVSRILDLLADNIKASKILALTFSNKAALELSERVQTAAGQQAVNIWTGTFHAFGLDTIRKHHGLFNVSADPRIVDASEGVAMLENALPALEIEHYMNLFEPALALRDILRAISRAKDELCTPERYAELAAAMKTRAVTDEEKLAAAKAAEVAIVYDHYQRQLRDEKAVDYGDLIMLPTLKMREDPDFRDLMRARFSHVHVDEYQDINRAAAMLVREIVGDGTNFWVVGDARQSIYRFRGASASNIARFETDYPSGTRRSLVENYRSTAEIVDSYSRFGHGMSVTRYAGSLALQAAQGHGDAAPTIMTLADDADEMDVLAGSIRGLESTGVALRDQTVLARSNATLSRFAEELEARGVPVLYLGPLFERAEVRDLLCVLSLIADDRGVELIRVAGFPEYRIPLDDALAIVGLARETEQRVVDLLGRLDAIEALSPSGRAGLLLLARHLHGATQGTTPWLLLSRYLFETSDYVRTVLAGQSPSDDMRRVAVRQLLDCVRNMPVQGTGAPIRRALDRVRHMILLSDERDLRQLPAELDQLDGVRLMTVHASKGLEFEAVHLPGLFAGAIPSANRPPACPPPIGLIEHREDDDAHEAEEECILFVAMSRAKSHLRLYRPTSRNGRTANPSRFLARVPVTPDRATARIPRLNPVPPSHPIPQPAAPAALSAADIQRYEDCPRRFFYERVLALRKKGRTSPYLDAHGCLQAVINHVRGLGPGVDYDPDLARAIFEQAWAVSGLETAPFGSAYRRLVTNMLDRLHVAAEGAAAHPGQLSTTIGTERISATADRILREGGATIIRNLKSGRPSASEADKLSSTILLKAAAEMLGSTARIETRSLLTGGTTAITQTGAKYGTRVTACQAAIANIRLGRYAPRESDFSCPRCAYLFVCPTPDGTSPA